MSVFTKEWTEEIRTRYERKPGYQRPRIYYFALSDTCQDMRNEIEHWVAGLPSTAQSKLTPRLQAEEHFQHTYHELAVGHMLGQLGYQPEYEKTICIASGSGLHLTLNSSMKPDLHSCRPQGERFCAGNEKQDLRTIV